MHALGDMLHSSDQIHVYVELYSRGRLAVEAIAPCSALHMAATVIDLMFSADSDIKLRGIELGEL